MTSVTIYKPCKVLYQILEIFHSVCLLTYAVKTHITNLSRFYPRVQYICFKRNIAFDRLIKEKTMAFRSGLSVAITACLLVNAIAYSAKHGTTLSKLTALQSLVFNNAQATVTLDSTALKQLVKLASNGKY